MKIETCNVARTSPREQRLLHTVFRAAARSSFAMQRFSDDMQFCLTAVWKVLRAKHTLRTAIVLAMFPSSRCNIALNKGDTLQC